MNKGKNKKEGDTDKALARAGEVAPETKDSDRSSTVSLDSIIAEKDEVKIAEEKMRQQRKSGKPKEKKPNQ